MKKFFTLAFAMTFAMAAQAQNYSAEESATGGKLAVEVQVNPFSNNFNTFRLNEGDNNYKVPSLKFRYFLSDRDAIRLRLGLGFDTDKTTDTDNTNTKFEPTTKSYTISDSKTEKTNKRRTFQIGLGYERHLAVMKRLSIYAGGELGLEFDKFSGEEKKDETGNKIDAGNYGTSTRNWTYSKTTEYKDKNSYGTKSSNAFFFNLFTGVDFQLYKGLYIGTELGLNFRTEKKKNGSETWNSNRVETNAYNSTSGNSTITTTTTTMEYSSETGITKTLVQVTNAEPADPTYSGGNNISTTETKKTSFKFYIEPALRIGWKF